MGIHGEEENQGAVGEASDPGSLPEGLPEPLPEDGTVVEALPADLAEGLAGNLSEALPELEEATSGTALDEILSTEILPEGADFVLPPDEDLALPTSPTFQLHFVSVPEAARAPLKKAFDANGISLSESASSSPSPVISQLTEYQAIAMLQAARTLGIQVSATVQRPAPVPSEDDLALGELAGIPEAALPLVESAPSVVLPKGEKEVMLCTPDQMPGMQVHETFGVILAHRSIARRLFREEDLREKLEKELKAVPNRASAPLPSSHLQVLLRDLLLDLRKSALGKGANAVLGVKIEAFPETAHSDPQLEQLRLVAFGTAAVVEKA